MKERIRTWGTFSLGLFVAIVALLVSPVQEAHSAPSVFCNTDSQCTTGLVCDVHQNRCICTSDASCESGTCNGATGNCEPSRGCGPSCGGAG